MNFCAPHYVREENSKQVNVLQLPGGSEDRAGFWRQQNINKY